MRGFSLPETNTKPVSFLRPKPPWFNKAINTKLARKRRIKAKGIAPIPKTKSAQRALAEWARSQPDSLKDI